MVSPNGAAKQDQITKRPKNISHLHSWTISEFPISEHHNIKQIQTVCDSLCHAGYSTPPSHTNGKMLSSGTETHEEEGACTHKLHVCSLQPLRSVGPCWDPQRKRCWCYPINLLSWDILAVRYGCLMLLYAAYHLWTLCLHAHATHSMVPGPLGQFDDDDLIVNETTRTTRYFFFHKNNGTGVQSNDATLQPAQEMSVALFFFNGCLLYRFNSSSPDEVSEKNKCLAGASVFWKDTAASVGV